MKKFFLALIAIAGLVALTPATNGQAVDPDKDLPEGKGKSIVVSVCQQCHGLSPIIESHRTLAEWTDTVNNMISNGAPLEADEVDTVAQYLAKNFGPEGESKDSARKSNEPDKK